MPGYTVIFIDTRGPTRLGTYDDKGLCRRAWKVCNAGAAILGPDLVLLECKTGTGADAERKLKAYAEHLRRQSGMATEAVPARSPAPAAPPAPARGRVSVAAVEVEVEEDDDEDDEDERDADEEDEALGELADEEDEEPASAPPPKPAPPPVAVEHARAAETFHAVAELARDAAVAVEPRPAEVTRAEEHARYIDRAGAKVVAEVTHALHPATGAVVQGDDAERITPVAPAATCARKGCTCAPSIAKPTRTASPASTLAAGLARARLHAELVAALGGIEAARELVTLVETHGGAAAVRDALAGLLDLARAA